MNGRGSVIAGVGLADKPKKSRWPARLDLMQSVSGLLLGLFMWAHMFLVSSILISKDVMWAVTKMFEGYFIFGKAYPILVQLVVVVVFVLFIGHALLAVRKFPANYLQYKTFRGHMKVMAHEDTSLWFWQVFTGFALFFLGSVHLYVMLVNADNIGPYASSDRVWSETMWPLYILLLLAVEFHGGIGLYRLAVKWGWFEGKDPSATRGRLKKLKWVITVTLLALGVATLAAYIKIGIEQVDRDRVGERYAPTSGMFAPKTPTAVPAAPAGAAQ